ncbi:MAG: PAS domain S-box protein [Sedimentisphaerales bacterium]|nr:PAS domain S-box protein [Sedimentisphaerales bacterium]
MSEPDLINRQQLEDIRILRPKNAGLEYIDLEISGNDEKRQMSHSDQSKFQSLIQTVPSAIFYLDSKYRIIKFNSGTEQIDGFKSRDVLGKNFLEMFVPERVRGKILKDINRMLAGGQACVFENFVKCADETEKLFSWELNRVVGEIGQPAGIIAVGKDITNQQWLYKLACIQRDLAIELSAVNQLDEGLCLCLEAAIEASKMDCGGVYLVDEVTGVLELVFHRGLSEEFIKSVVFYDVNSDNAKLVMEGKPVFAEYKQLDLLLDGTKKLEGLRSVAVMPILYEGQVIGCLNVASHIFEHIYTQSRLALETLAAQIGSTVARLKTKEILYDREQMYHKLVDASAEAVFVLDLDARITYVSPQGIELLGYENAEDVIGLNGFQSLPPDEVERGRSRFRQTIIDGFARGVEHTFIKKDGTRIRVENNAAVVSDVQGQPKALIITSRDVTERRKAEESLRKGEEQLRLAVKAAQLSSWDWDLLTNEVRIGGHSNEVLGLATDIKNIHASYLLEHINQADIRQVQQAISEAINEKSLFSAEYRIARPDGTDRWVEAKGQPLYDKAGKPMRMIGMNRDITEHKKAVERLRKSEERFKVLFKSAPDAYYIHDLECTFIDVNKAAEELIGYGREEIVGNNFFEMDLATEEDISKVLMALSDNKDGRPSGPLELTLFRKDGSKCLVETRSYPVEVEGQTVVLGIARDITERRHLEEAYYSLVDHSIQGLSIIQDGRMVFLNEAFSLITGYSGGDMSTATPEQLRSLVHPEDQDMVWTRHRDRLAGKPLPERYEFRCVRKDGSTRWLEIHASKIEYRGRPAIQSSFIDITERKEAQEALKQSREEIQKQNEFLNNVLESLTYPLLVIDADNYKVKIANAAARLAKSSGDVTCYRLLHRLDKPCDGSNYPCPIREIKSLGRAVTTEHIHEDGGDNPQYVEVHSCPIVDKNGKVTDIIEYCFDITKRKRAEEKLIAYQAQLRSLASELSLAEERERRHIAAELHDQISQTLALSKINLQTLGKSAGLEDSSILKEIIKSIENTIEQVQSLTFDLSSPTLYKFGLVKAIDELLYDYIKKTGITYTLNVDKSQKLLDEDIMVLLFQSVRELLINIIKHSQARKVEVTINRDEDNIRIIVCDDGVGFDTNRFESYEQRTGGFGLFNIRERLNYISGSFKIESQPGKGCRIMLIAPLKDGTG